MDQMAKVLSFNFFISSSDEYSWLISFRTDWFEYTQANFQFSGSLDGKASAYNAGDPGSIPGSGRSGEGNGNPLQYSCLENPMDRGAWWATDYGVTESRTRLRDFTFPSLWSWLGPASGSSGGHRWGEGTVSLAPSWVWPACSAL